MSRFDFASRTDQRSCAQRDTRASISESRYFNEIPSARVSLSATNPEVSPVSRFDFASRTDQRSCAQRDTRASISESRYFNEIPSARVSLSATNPEVSPVSRFDFASRTDQRSCAQRDTRASISECRYFQRNSCSLSQPERNQSRGESRVTLRLHLSDGSEKLRST